MVWGKRRAALCGLETGTPSRLTSPSATWARSSPGWWGGVGLTFVRAEEGGVEGWWVTRQTSMSDMSEQLARRPRMCSCRRGPSAASQGRAVFN